MAFTVSEVLITLAVLGVVSAFTIPVVSALWQKEVLRTQFNKAYADLDNFAKQFYMEHNYNFGRYAYNHTYDEIVNMMLSYYNSIGVTSNDTWESEQHDPTYTLRLLSGKNLGIGTATSHTLCDNSSQFADISGRLYRFNDKKTTKDQGKTTNGPIICVDTNGAKGPNRYGYDYFVFIFTVDGGVIPMGMEHKNNTASVDLMYNGFVSGSDYCSKKGDKTRYNASCAYYAFMDQHPADSNKSYWKDFL